MNARRFALMLRDDERDLAAMLPAHSPFKANEVGVGGAYAGGVLRRLDRKGVVKSEYRLCETKDYEITEFGHEVIAEIERLQEIHGKLR